MQVAKIRKNVFSLSFALGYCDETVRDRDDAHLTLKRGQNLIFEEQSRYTLHSGETGEVAGRR